MKTKRQSCCRMQVYMVYLLSLMTSKIHLTENSSGKVGSSDPTIAPNACSSSASRSDQAPQNQCSHLQRDIMEWWTFWEQFDNSVHSKPQLLDPVKLASLRQALKDGPARHTIEGRSGTVSNYHEAITMM